MKRVSNKQLLVWGGVGAGVLFILETLLNLFGVWK
jgi:hypothetical protein